MRQKDFLYQFNAGPLPSEKELSQPWTAGNCRRAVQWYWYKLFGKFFAPEEILCPSAYYNTGEFLFQQGQAIDFSRLEDGDIIYAEKIVNKDGIKVDRGRYTFNSEDEYIVSLHTALFTKKPNQEIWHATAIEGKSCYWSLEKFLEFYNPMAVKRVHGD